jgi:AcrR family transcriptional regulator
MGDETQTKPVRRRGAALDHALLAAAWTELCLDGYAHFTMDAVADRAQTSRPVLYRRWPHRWDLVIAAVRHHHEQNPLVVPDTGSLRGDLIAYLAEVSAKRAEFAALFSVQLAQYFDDTGSSPRQLREQITGGRHVGAGVDTVWERAVERGEIDAATLTPRVKSLAFDLLRNELMMTLQPAPEETLIEIIDQIVLPLVTSR